MMFNLNLKKRIFIFLFSLSLILLNLRVSAQVSDGCQTCIDFWSELSVIDDKKQCKKTCKKKVKEDDYQYSPVCEKKRGGCCKKLCNWDSSAFKACKKAKYCTKEESQQPTPTATPTASLNFPFPENWCPDFSPGSDTECLLTGWWTGTCYYSSSHQSGETPNTDSQACRCNYQGNSEFQCAAAPFPGGRPTSPPSIAPPPTAPVAPTAPPTFAPPPENWCPRFFPDSGIECLLTNPYRGTCFYSSSAQQGEIPNTDSQACKCNYDGTSIFDCESAPFPGGIPTAPPTVMPEPPPDDWCPDYFPGSDSDCLLTNPYYGTCFYSSSAQEGDPSNTDSQACVCNRNGNSKFSCESAPFPGGIPTAPPVTVPDPPPDNWCPRYFPGTGEDCLLTIPYVGTCYYTSSHQEGEQPNDDSQACRCNSQGNSQFLCESKPFPGWIPTPPPASAPDPPPSNWCPRYFPGSGTDCLLTSPYAGNCYYSSSNQEGEPPNDDSQRCECNGSGDSKFQCVPAPFPGSDSRYLVENYFEQRSLSDEKLSLDHLWMGTKTFDESPTPMLESSLIHM